MNSDEMIDRLQQARELLAPILAGGAEPQLEAILRGADRELHWALWNLGVAVTHRSDMGSPQAAAGG